MTEDRREYHRAWREAHPDYDRDHMRQKRAANPEASKQAARLWRQRNPDKVKEQIRKRCEIRKNDPEYIEKRRLYMQRYRAAKLAAAAPPPAPEKPKRGRPAKPPGASKPKAPRPEKEPKVKHRVCRICKERIYGTGEAHPQCLFKRNSKA